MSEILDPIWNWYFHIDWTKAGGSSFVEIVTGLNIALIGWDKFRERVTMPKTRCEMIIRATVSSITDSMAETNLARVFRRASRPAVIFMNSTWVMTSVFSLLFSFVGIYMLYADRYCCHDWILVVPLAFHLASMTLTLAVFWLFAWGVTWSCNVNGHSLTKAIDKLASKGLNLQEQGAMSDGGATGNKVPELLTAETQAEPEHTSVTTRMARKKQHENRLVCSWCKNSVAKKAVNCRICSSVFTN